MLIQRKITIGKLSAIIAAAAVNAAAAGENVAQNSIAVDVRRPVPVMDAKVGGFWHDEYRLLVTKWLPHCIKEMEAGGRGEELLNLVATGEVLAGKKPSVKFKGCPWSDAYPYNTLEAICLALEIDPGDDVGFAKAQEFLRAKMEEWIPVILAAQEPSGYIHSYHDLRREPHFSNAASHEFYVMGYFIEMGIAHYRATKGRDRRLYDAAIRCADHLDSVFGPPPKRTWLNGHPGLEYALCRLADSVNATEGAGKGEKYARLARHFIRNQYRAEGNNGKWKKDYHQADLPAWEMKDAAGHAVRAVYFYSAMSALASRLGDAELGAAADRLFDSAINRKEYLTGGVGAAWHGEAFAGDYELGNNGYCESCASCGMSFWTIEQHRRKPGTWPVDVQERLVYNNLLGAISEDGEKFFYQNPLDSDKRRYPWHACPCCVGNVPRALFALKDNAYSVSGDGRTLYADHFLTLEGAVGKVAGVEMSIRQQTGYPWDGKATFRLAPEKPVAFTFAVRVPNRIDSALYTVEPDVRGRFTLTVNGEKADAALSDDGYLRIARTWKNGDEVALEFPMPVQRVHCDERVAANRGLVAFQRGPIVYSFEQVDQKMPLSAAMAAPDDEFSEFWMSGLFGGVVAIRSAGGLVAVPNFARLNRAAGRAAVWIPEPKVKEAKEELFPLSRIRLEDGVLKTQQEQNRKYLLRLEPDRLLSRFRSEAGLKPKAKPYNGWEAPDRRGLDLAGHILGFYMAGAAMTFEATGDEELKRRLEYVVDELEAVQNAQGDGYALAVKDGRKLFAEIASGKIDVKVDPKTEYCAFVNGRFEPVYTLNKILIGLHRIYIATGSEKAKRVFLRLSDWFGDAIVEKLDDAQLQRLLACEHGSLPETFADAFLMTGEEKYRRWARRLCHENMLAPLADGRADRLVFHHANNEIPKFTGFERVYRITGEERLHRSLVNAWNAFAHDHAWANGGNSHREHLFPKVEFERKLFMDGGPESCNSVNMLRETEALFQTEPSADKVDYYERVLFSHLLSTHEPMLGRTAYYTPVKPGASRTYSDEFESMWCCTGTGFESPGKYAQMVFTHAPDNSSVSVQLFASAMLDWKERGVKLRQKTDFPYGETSLVTVESVGKDAKFAIKVRRPAWAKDGFAVSVNGERVDAAADVAGYVVIERAWKKGDRIDLSFPMALRAERLPGSNNYAAFFYGPTLLVGDMGSEGLAREDYIAKPPSNPNSSMKLGKPLAMPDVPASALGNPGEFLKREQGAALAFRLKGSGMRLVPISDLHFRRYTMYWRLVDKATTEALAAADARAAQLHETCLDEVLIGDDASEKAHGLAVERSATGTGLYGEYNQYHWRHALSGGFFSYRLAVGNGPGDRTLVVKYYARERGRRAFDVLVDGTPVRSESLGDTGSPGFVFRETRIPAKLLDGKKTIEVRFVPRAGNTAGGVFGLWLVRPGFGEGAYLFTYFSDKPHDGRSGEAAGLHIAYSRDGLKWTALNDDKPVLVPEVGAKKLMRDPSIARGPDGTFHLVWTTSWHDRIIGHASSKDLIHWSAQEAIPVMMHEPKARNCWAPELTYNPDDGRFYIYWATTIPGADASESRPRHRIYMTSTKDWKEFSKTKLWFDPGFSAIDAALLKMYGGEKKWLMFVKNEENPPEGKNVRTLWLDDLSSRVPTDAISAPITGDWVEGPSPLQVGDAIYLYFDQYKRHCYGAVRSDDNGKTWRDVSDQVQFPKGIRHGTALAVEKSFVDALVAVDAAPTLEEGFVHPPNAAKPHTWYHMMNGNVTKAGITRDFEALAKAGVGGVQMFDAGCAIPPGPLKFNSPDWFDLFRHAQKEAKRLNLEICIPNCSGWSSSGGPWNTPANAMKVTVFTETPVKGGSHFSGVLPRTKDDHGFYADIAVLAYPTPAAGAKISDLAKKTGLARGRFARDVNEPDVGKIVAKASVIDLTAKMGADGKLEWDVPDGDWTVLRMGFVCNGRCNHPASEKGRGLEVDKLSASAMDFHFSQYVTRLCKTLGISSATDNSTGFNNILVDSYEVGCQNWTQGLDATFEKRMGYSLRPYLPVFAGRVVGSVEESERFLEDFRRVLADLFAENYAGRLTKLCHDHGLMCSIEPYGNSNADDLQYGQDVDIPMAEFWSAVTDGDRNFGEAGNSRFAAYLAHVWGRRYAATESFTAGPPSGGRWRTTPYSIKAQGDRVYADGINRIVYHRFAHQPWADDRHLPGMTMGRWGMHFDRTQTWWRIAPEWLRYQARCQWMLQEGRSAADVLFWCGESAPNSGKAATAGLDGYDWDVCATKAVEMLTVRNGKIVAPGGVEYEMLVLPGNTKDVSVAHGVVNIDNDETTMSERMVRKIGELVAAGAKVVAPVRPARAPGLAGWPGSDERLRAAVDEVWGRGVMECGAAEAVKRLGIAPDFTADAPDTSWIHRRGDGADWYFVANGSRTPVSFEASFRQAGRVPEIWDAETGMMCDAPVWRVENGRTVVRLDFRPSGSAFVVFRKPSKARHLVAVSTSLDAAAKPERKHELVINKAEYGVFDGKVPSIDITKKLAAKVRDGRIVAQMNNELAGRDPARFVGKLARIRYTYDGKVHDVEVLEGEILQIPEDTGVQPPPAWEWRDGEILAWQPMTARLSYSDGTARSVSANPKPPLTVDGTWRVSFPVDWYTGGANVKTVVWPALKDWTTDDDPNIKYFSGTATYRVSCPKSRVPVGSRVLLDLGEVRNFAEVKVNGKAYPALWRPPYRVDITDAVANAESVDLEIKVTNLWPNRLIGDDRLYGDDCEWKGVIRKGSKEVAIKEIPQWVKNGKPSPTGRHTFTTWKHWSKEDDLLPSGLIGPVKLWFGDMAAE